MIDHSTYLEPFQYSTGINTVIVNGKLVLDNGQPAGRGLAEPCDTAWQCRRIERLATPQLRPDVCRAFEINKPARERIPNDHLSPGRLKSDRLAGWSRRLQDDTSRLLELW